MAIRANDVADKLLQGYRGEKKQRKNPWLIGSVSTWIWCYLAKRPTVQLWKEWACVLWAKSSQRKAWAEQGGASETPSLCECVDIRKRAKAQVSCYVACAVRVETWWWWAGGSLSDCWGSLCFQDTRDTRAGPCQSAQPVRVSLDPEIPAHVEISELKVVTRCNIETHTRAQPFMDYLSYTKAFFHTCSVIQPRCLTSMPGCMLLISSFTRGKRLAAPAWMALYQDWAMAGSFALRNTEFFLLDEITSKYLANEMTEKENDARRKT